MTQLFSYDLDFPLEVDDEYWDTGNAGTNFKQPSHLPSKIVAFNQFIKLTEIIAFTAKTLVSEDPLVRGVTLNSISRTAVSCGQEKDFFWFHQR